MTEQLGTPIQGVTLYSFTRAFHGREYDLEGLIRAVVENGFGPGLEIVGFSSLRGFPDVGDEFVAWFRDLVDEVELVPTALSINADIGIHRTRRLTQEELVEYMRLQIVAAARLGFPLARVQISLTPDSMAALEPVARSHGVTLALEVHADQHAAHPRILALRDQYERIGSPFLGFTADWGASTIGIAPSLLEAYERRDAPVGLLRKAEALWDEYHLAGPPVDDVDAARRYAAFRSLAGAFGRPDLAIDLAVNAVGIFGCAETSSWVEIMPWIRHVHGKFFGIDDNHEEPSVPIRELVRLLVESGYSGAISSEYEGWHWNSWESPFDIVRDEQAIQRAAAEDAESRMITDAGEARSALSAHLGTGAASD